MKSKAGERIFDLLLLIILIVFLYNSFFFNARAKVFPFYFSLIAIALVGLQLIVNLMKNPPKWLRFILQEGTMSGLGEEEEEEPVPWPKVAVMTAWLVGFLIALYYLNYLLATFLFLTLLMLVSGKVPPVKTLSISVGFTAFLYLLFEVILNH